MAELDTPLNVLLWDCLERRTTSCSERGTSASIQKQPGETILVFRTDSEAMRRAFGLQKACDRLFFYMKEQSRPNLIFVELKGTDVKRAAEQLKETILQVKRVLGAIARPFIEGDSLHAVIVFQGGAPRELEKIQQDFRKQVGIPLKMSRSPADLRTILEPSPRK
jgi:hypothetical protein